MPLPPGELIERIRTATGSGVTVVSMGDFRLSVRGESSAQWMLGKKSVSFDAIMALDAVSGTLTYWEMLTERSSGITAGFFMDKYSQKGISRNESGTGTMVSGESYTYDFGSYQSRMRAVAESAEWQFRQVFRKP